MIITNANVLDNDFKFTHKDICIAGAKFADVSSDGKTMDANGLYAVPGLIDLHFHGCVGYDFADGTIEGINAIASHQSKNGVTALSPATLTLPVDELERICATAAGFTPDDSQSALVGIHLEGPFVSKEKIGAQNPKYVIVPDTSTFDRLMSASGGLVKLISLAPEAPGGIDFITAVSSRVTCSIAHTTADYQLATKAIAAGSSHVTHLYNAMPPFNHREPGVIGAAFDSPSCMVELITDNVHIHPSVVRATFKMFTDERVILVSDSMRATDLSDGSYTLGGLEVTVLGRKATLASGNIAGSATNLMNCVRVAVTEMGIPLESAVKCASLNPALSLGISDTHGSIASGKMADMVLLDKQLNIKHVILRGKVAHSF